jgi:hypothetical protein
VAVAELAPGIFVSNLVPTGSAFVMALAAVLPDGPERGIALHPEDWERVPGAERERILDDVTRGDAGRGMAKLDRFLAAQEGQR